jgi:hypothetical protein
MKIREEITVGALFVAVLTGTRGLHALNFEQLLNVGLEVVTPVVMMNTIF